MDFDWTPFITSIRFDEEPFRKWVLLDGGAMRRVFHVSACGGGPSGFEVVGARDRYRTKLTLSHQARRETTAAGMAFDGGYARWTMTGLRCGVPAALVFRVNRCDPLPGLIVEMDGERIGEIEPLGRAPTKFRPGG